MSEAGDEDKAGLRSRRESYGLSKATLTMPHHELDALDRRILAVLQNNGRMSNAELAEAVRLSAPPCLRRKATLEVKGIIRRYYAKLNHKKLGFLVEGFVSVRLAAQSQGAIEDFEVRVRTWPEVRECYALQGHTDFLLRCVVHDLGELQRFVTQKLMTEAGVAGVKTSVTVRQTKSVGGVPVADDDPLARNRMAERITAQDLGLKKAGRRHA